MTQYSSREELQTQGIQIIARPPTHFKPRNRRGVASQSLARIRRLRLQAKTESKTVELVYRLLVRLTSISPLHPADNSEMKVRRRIRAFFQRFQ